MTVADLIRELQQMPPHTRVCVENNVELEDDNGCPVTFQGAVDLDDVRHEGQYILLRPAP